LLGFQWYRYRIELDAANTAEKLGALVYWNADTVSFLTRVELRFFWTVSVVSFHDKPLTDQDFAQLGPRLARLRGLRHLYLVRTMLTDQSAHYFKELPYVMVLDVRGTPFSDELVSDLMLQADHVEWHE
jgi:hypothetical protein